MGGPVFGLKRAIDEGVMIGPRIYPSGAFISQTSGHGDFRFRFELPRLPGGPLSHSEVERLAAIADSPDEVRLREREQLRHGASQISRQLLVPTFCSMRRLPAARERSSPSWSAGTRLPRRSRWPPQTMAS